MRGDWKDEAMQYRDVDRAAQKKAEEAMTQTRETPRTDALWISHGPQPAVLSYQKYRDMLDLARTLERELAEANALTLSDAKCLTCGSGNVFVKFDTSELAERDATIARLTQALNIIASWGEGPDVNSSFDEPSSAAEARAALAKATP